MDQHNETPLTERKVVRRGLLAGLAGLGGAALLKVAGGAKHVEAAPIAMLIPGAPGDGSTFNQSFASTFLQAGTPFPGGGGPMLLVDATSSTSAVSIDGIFSNAKGPNGSGVTGVGGTGGSSTSYGVQGLGGNSTGSFSGSPGVRGVGGGSGAGFGGTGVLGVAGSGGNGISGSGVLGTSVNSVGVFGSSQSGAGVKGESTGGPGVVGQSAGQPGVDGASSTSLGVRGTSTFFVGVVGISTNSHGLYGSTNAGVNGFGIVAENLGANGRGMLVTGGQPSQFYGGLQVFGPKNAVLKMQDGTFGSVYCQESPEPYFEDFGRAQMVGGVANVPLEREFATLVAGADYMVFPVAEGETRGLFVSRRTPGGFEVREMQGGTGNVPFTYRIVTRRKDIEGKRFARVSTEAAEKVAGVRAALAAMGAPGSPSGSPSDASSPQPVPPVIRPPVVPGGPGSTIVPPGAGP